MDLRSNSAENRQPGNTRGLFLNLANLISAFGFAPVLSIPAFILIIMSGGTGNNIVAGIGVALAFGSLFPSLAMYSFVKVKGISYDNRESRTIPLLTVSLIYFAGTLILAVLSEPVSSIILMFCYGTNTLAIYIINTRWKISVHAMGVAGPTTALVFSIGALGGTLGLLMLPIVWSRLYLRKHTPGQVALGGMLGYVLTSFQFFLAEIFVFHESVGVLTVLLSITVLSLPFIAFTSYNSSRSFRYSFFLLIFSSILIGYLVIFVNQVEIEYLLVANLILFLSMLFLPGSRNSRIRIAENLLHRESTV